MCISDRSMLETNPSPFPLIVFIVVIASSSESSSFLSSSTPSSSSIKIGFSTPLLPLSSRRFRRLIIVSASSSSRKCKRWKRLTNRHNKTNHLKRIHFFRNDDRRPPSIPKPGPPWPRGGGRWRSAMSISFKFFTQVCFLRGGKVKISKRDGGRRR